MVWALSVIAAVAALLAVMAALRTQRHVRRLARALAREWDLRSGGGGGAGPASAGTEPRVGASDATLRHSVQALEQRLSEVLARVTELDPAGGSRFPAPALPASSTGEPLDPRQRVQAELAARGFEEIRVLAARPGDAGLVFEARKQGMPTKGRAQLDEDGRVELRWASAVRMFP